MCVSACVACCATLFLSHFHFFPARATLLALHTLHSCTIAHTHSNPIHTQFTFPSSAPSSPSSSTFSSPPHPTANIRINLRSINSNELEQAVLIDEFRQHLGTIIHPSKTQLLSLNQKSGIAYDLDYLQVLAQSIIRKKKKKKKLLPRFQQPICPLSLPTTLLARLVPPLLPLRSLSRPSLSFLVRIYLPVRFAETIWHVRLDKDFITDTISHLFRFGTLCCERCSLCVTLCFLHLHANDWGRQVKLRSASLQLF